MLTAKNTYLFGGEDPNNVTLKLLSIINQSSHSGQIQ